MANITYSDILLEKIELIANRIIKGMPNSGFHREEINLYEHFKDGIGSMRLELSDYVWAEKFQDTEYLASFEIKYPATWWQHFKQQYFPPWLLKKFPIQEKAAFQIRTINFQRLALYPKFRRASTEFVIHERILDVENEVLTKIARDFNPTGVTK